MKISLEAKDILLDMMKNNDLDCLWVLLEESCQGLGLNFTLAKKKEGDEIVTVDGIDVLMDQTTGNRSEHVTLFAQDGKLYVEDPEAGSCSDCDSGCGSSCGSGCHA